MRSARMESWANAVRAFRLARGLTQREAAELLGVSQPTFSRWEAGRQVPDAATRLRLRQRMEALSGLRQRLLEEVVRRSPVAQMLIDADLRVLAVSAPLAVLLGREPADLEGVHEPGRHPLGREASETLRAVREAGLAEGRIAFAEAFDVVEGFRADALHLRQLWIPEWSEIHPPLVRIEVGRVDAAVWRLVRGRRERVRITTRHELEVVPVATATGRRTRDHSEA